MSDDEPLLQLTPNRDCQQKTATSARATQMHDKGVRAPKDSQIRVSFLYISGCPMKLQVPSRMHMHLSRVS